MPSTHFSPGPRFAIDGGDATRRVRPAGRLPVAHEPGAASVTFPARPTPIGACIDRTCMAIAQVVARAVAA